MREIQQGQSLRCRDPELAIACKSRVGFARAGFWRRKAVRSTKRCKIERFIRATQSLETGQRDSNNAASREPEVPILRLHHVVRFDIRSDISQPIVLKAEDSSVMNQAKIKPSGSILPSRVGGNLGNGLKVHKPVPNQSIDSMGGSTPDAAGAILI